MNSQIKQRIESVISNLDQLPSIPTVATKIITMVNNPDVSFKIVAEEISKDQVITTNVLKLCNSAYFSCGKEITSIERAIITLGIKEVKDIVIIASTKTVLNKSILGYDLAKGDLWKHGIAVAVLSKKIALLKKRKDIADIAFTGGIIHDVGKTVIALYVQNTFNEILTLVDTEKITFNLAEKEIMGFDHQEVGEKILSKWNFPEVLKAIVMYHHNPDDAPDDFKKIVSVIHVANTLCLMAGIGIGNDGLYHELSSSALQQLNLNDSDIEMLYSDIPDIVDVSIQIA